MLQAHTMGPNGKLSQYKTASRVKLAKAVTVQSKYLKSDLMLQIIKRGGMLKIRSLDTILNQIL
ncbi:hypothetical protein D3C81_2206740 [compost metagenome]